MDHPTRDELTYRSFTFRYGGGFICELGVVEVNQESTAIITFFEYLLSLGETGTKGFITQ
jgi:hypothetical protein